MALRAARPAVSAEGFVILLALQRYSFGFNYPPLQNNFDPDKRSTEYRAALTSRLN